MRAVHFSAIWLGITAQAPDSFQTLCVRGKLFPLPRRAAEHWRPAFCDGEISWNGYYVSPNCRPPGSINATSSMKGPPWAGTMSRITLLIVAPGLELLFPQTPVPKLDRFEKPCSWQNSKIQTNTRVVWQAGDLPMHEMSATPFIMLLIHSVG